MLLRLQRYLCILWWLIHLPELNQELLKQVDRFLFLHCQRILKTGHPRLRHIMLSWLKFEPIILWLRLRATTLWYSKRHFLQSWRQFSISRLLMEHLDNLSTVYMQITLQSLLFSSLEWANLYFLSLLWAQLCWVLSFLGRLYWWRWLIRPLKLPHLLSQIGVWLGQQGLLNSTKHRTKVVHFFPYFLLQ